MSKQKFVQRCQRGTAGDLRRSNFEVAGRDLRLTDDGLERAALDLIVIRHNDGDSGIVCLFLHYDVAASLPDGFEPVICENSANLVAGQDAELTQQLPLAV